MTKPNPKLKHPDKKISENFLDFAAPLLDTLPENPGEAELDPMLKVAFMAWNAVVYADAVNNQKFLSEMRTLLGHDAISFAIVEGMIRRKRDLFGNDHRLIGEYKIIKENGGFKLRAEARTPYSETRT